MSHPRRNGQAEWREPGHIHPQTLFIIVCRAYMICGITAADESFIIRKRIAHVARRLVTDVVDYRFSVEGRLGRAVTVNAAAVDRGQLAAGFGGNVATTDAGAAGALAGTLRTHVAKLVAGIAVGLGEGEGVGVGGVAVAGGDPLDDYGAEEDCMCKLESERGGGWRTYYRYYSTSSTPIQARLREPLGLLGCYTGSASDTIFARERDIHNATDQRADTSYKGPEGHRLEPLVPFCLLHILEGIET